MYESDMADWDYLPNGDLEVEPLAGFEAGAAPGLVLLRLDILVAPDQIGTAQISIPADQADELARTLSWLARRSRSSATEGRA